MNGHAPPTTLTEFPSLVKTRWSCDDPKLQYAVENPATGELITTVQAGNAETVDAAVQASQAAFDHDWRWRYPSERGALLLQVADKLDENKEELARLLCMENGKPYLDALAFDLTFLVKVFKYFGSLVDKLPSEFYDQGSVYVSVVHEPFGVCAGILPWNWPREFSASQLCRYF